MLRPSCVSTRGLLEELLERRILLLDGSMGALILGAAPCPHALKERAVPYFKDAVYEFYGATETGAGVTFLRPEQHRLDDQTKLKSCGSILPLIDIKKMSPAVSG